MWNYGRGKRISLLPVSDLGRGPNRTEPGLQQKESSTEDQMAPPSFPQPPPSFAEVTVHFSDVVAP